MKRILSILCALALTLGCLVTGAVAAETGRKVDVWDLTGAAMENAANQITPAAWVESGALVDGTLSNGTEVSFGDLTFVHNANDRVYSAVESADWGGILGGNAQNKYGHAYDDGYEALGGWYCNGAGGESKRYILLDNVQAGDKIVVYAGSASGEVSFHFDAQTEGADQRETAAVAASEFGRFTFVARYDGTYKLWTDPAGKAMWHRVVRYPGTAVSGSLTLPEGFDLSGYGLKFVNQTTRQETAAQLEGSAFSAILAPGYTYNAVLTGATGWGLTADTRSITLSDADAGESRQDKALTVEAKSTYTYSGKVVGFASGYDVSQLALTMVPEEGSGSEPVALTVDPAGLTFHGVLDPTTRYTVTLEGANDYVVSGPAEVTGEGVDYAEDITVTPKAVYPVSGGYLGLEDGAVTALTFEDLDDGYLYPAALTEQGWSVRLRSGAYAARATVEGGYATRTHVVVEDEAVEKDLLFVSTAEKPAVEWVKDIYVGCPDKAPNFDTVSAAVDAASRMGIDSESKRVTVHIAPGTYREQVIVDTPYLSFVNDQPDKEVLLTWYYGIGYRYYSAGAAGNGYYDAQNAYDRFEKNVADRWGTAVRVKPEAVGFRAEHITFENSFNRYVTDEELADGVEPSGDTLTLARNYSADVESKKYTERAAALCVEADGAEFYRCSFLSSQDTLYTAADAYFKNCLIEGQTDYIFGSGNVVFDGCELRWKGYSDGSVGGYITAARQSAEESGYLFRACAVTANPALTVTPGCLGRPWGADGAVVFQDTRLERADLIVAEGWTEMSGNQPEKARFGEFRTVTMAGAPVDTSQRIGDTQRAGRADIADYLGGWTPYYYRPEAGSALAFASDPILTDNGDINLPYPGHTLTVGYSLGEDNDADVSTLQWCRIAPDGGETLIKTTAANVSRSYQIRREDVGARIKVTVTPATVGGKEGEGKSYTLLETVKDGWNDPGAKPGQVALGEGVNLFLAGDSTVKDYSAEGMYNDGKLQTEGSWGEFLQAFFDPEQVTVVNYAQGGRSARSFLNEGSLDKIAEQIGAGDYLFIQFGHNDASNADASHLTERHAPLGTPDANGVYPTTPGVKQATPAGLPSSWGEECYTWDCGGTYKWYLLQYIEVARNAGATPVLVTPVCRMYYEPDGSIKPHHDESTSEVKNNAYCTAVRQLAAEENVPLLDAFALTERMFTDAYAACGSATYGQQVMCVGESTHSNKLGGMIEAGLVAGAIQELGVSISPAVQAPAKVLGQTPKGETAFTISGAGTFTPWDMLTDYTQEADYWQGVGQRMFDAIGDKAQSLAASAGSASQPAVVSPSPAVSDPAVPAGTYTVRKGDSLWRIAKALYGDGRKYVLIFEANRDSISDPNAIYVGQRLTIPEG